MKSFRSFRFRLIAMILVFFASAFLLPACRTGDSALYLLGAAVPGFMLVLLLLPSRIVALDLPSLSAALALCGLGILAPAAVYPDMALAQGIHCISSLFFLFAGAVIVRVFRPSLFFSAIAAGFSLVLLSAPLWLTGNSFSTAEGGTALLLVAVSAFLSMRLRLPAVVLSLAGLSLLLAQADYSSSVVWSLACILLFWAASGSALWSLVTMLSIGSLLGGWIVFSPFSGFSLQGSALQRFPLFPLFPPGFESIPENAKTDSLFLFLGNRYGLIILICAVLLLILLLMRGTSLALNARKAFHASLAFGAVLLLGMRALVFLSAFAGFLPVTPGEFPLITFSVSDLSAQFFLLGVLSGVSSRNETDLEEDVRLSMLAR